LKAARIQPTGVVARLSNSEGAVIAARSGASARIALSASMEGFSPLELLDASLAACLAISVKLAARKLGFDDRIDAVRIEVKGEKADDLPARVARQTCRFAIEGRIGAEDRRRLIAEAHALCTISHTLAGGLEIVDGAPLD